MIPPKEILSAMGICNLFLIPAKHISTSMLTESLIAAVSNPEKSTNNTLTKDAGIFIHEYQPLATLRTSFKKSSINANCLAANASHIFAAQAGKAIVHVYSRDRGNQEAIVPFPEQITSLSLVGNYDNAGILALGTEGGRLMLWEVNPLAADEISTSELTRTSSYAQAAWSRRLNHICKPLHAW